MNKNTKTDGLKETGKLINFHQDELEIKRKKYRE